MRKHSSSILSSSAGGYRQGDEPVLKAGAIERLTVRFSYSPPRKVNQQSAEPASKAVRCCKALGIGTSAFRLGERTSKVLGLPAKQCALTRVFGSRPTLSADAVVAQLAEHLFCKQEVRGSIPLDSSN